MSGRYLYGSAAVNFVPCKAADAVAGDSANASRSLRRAEDCLRAELKREFCTRC